MADREPSHEPEHPTGPSPQEDYPGTGPTPPPARAGRLRWLSGGRAVGPALFAVAGAVIGGVITVAIIDGRSSSSAQLPRTSISPTAPSMIKARTSVAAPPAVPARIPAVAKPNAAQVGLLHVRPISVAIPTIGVSSSLVGLGLMPDGTVQVPSNFAQAGWYDRGPYPGDADGPPALILGHIDSYTGPAVFFRLTSLHNGDRVYVKRADNSTAVFVVYRSEHYLKTAFPAASVYAPTARAEIRLITCTGQFDEHARSYLSNLVVYAYLDVSRSR